MQASTSWAPPGQHHRCRPAAHSPDITFAAVPAASGGPRRARGLKSLAGTGPRAVHGKAAVMLVENSGAGPGKRAAEAQDSGAGGKRRRGDCPESPFDELVRAKPVCNVYLSD